MSLSIELNDINENIFEEVWPLKGRYINRGEIYDMSKKINISLKEKGKDYECVIRDEGKNNTSICLKNSKGFIIIGRVIYDSAQKNGKK